MLLPLLCAFLTLAPPPALDLPSEPPVDLVEFDIGNLLLAADLDGRPGDEVIAIVLPDGRGPAPVMMMKWVDGGFSKFADGRLGDTGWSASVADTDEDGKDEVLTMTERGAVSTLRLQGDELVESVSAPLTDREVVEFVFGRFGGEPMLVLAVDSRMGRSGDSDEEPTADALLFFRPVGDRWVRAFRAPFQQTGMSLDLLAAPWDGADDLIAAGNMPSDVSTSEYELLRVRGERVETVARMEFATDKRTGLQGWTHAFRRSDRNLFFSTAFYTVGEGDEYKVTDRTELRSYADRDTRLLGQIPGQVLVVGDFVGPGRTTVITVEYPRVEGQAPRMRMRVLRPTAFR